eukprot:GAHX01001081.1.p1 GENE.GAHX01001081.1~~GAHX01001081.1.p1  ORF type:complete len:357 (+),score=47.28 GAHX01001081.1:82-1152(+)
MSKILSIFTITTLLFSPSLQWAIHVHQIILQLALDGISNEIKDDLSFRIKLFKDIRIHQQIAALASIPDKIRDSNSFSFMDKYHGGEVFKYEGGMKVNKHQPVITSVAKFYSYLVQPSSSNIILDTFSLVYLLHTTGEIFQPFHTTVDSGHKTSFSGSSHLHGFWDYTCNFLTPDLNGAVKELKNIIDTKKIKIDGSNTIDVTLNEKFKADFNIDNTIALLQSIYERKIGDKILLEQILDPKSMSTNEYKKLCISIALPNLIHSAWTIKAMLEKIYRNKKNTMIDSFSQITTTTTITNQQDKTNGIRLSTVCIVFCTIFLTLIMIIAALKHYGLIYFGFGDKKRRKVFDKDKPSDE